MRVKVSQLVINNLKLTKSIVKQLNPIPIKLVHYLATTREGQVLGYVNLSKKRLIIVEAAGGLYKLEFVTLTSAASNSLRSSDPADSNLVFASKDLKESYLKDYNILKALATKHIYM